MSLTTPTEINEECRDVHAAPDEFAKICTLNRSSGGIAYQAIAFLTIVLPIVGVGLALVDAFQYGVSWLNIGLFLLMYVWAVSGIGLGYHRYLTHRSLKTSNWMRAFFIFSGCIAGHGQPIWWCAVHRRHHQYSDHQGDPHSPNLHGEGFIGMLIGCWHSHIGWMFEPDHTAAYASHFAKDLLNDRLVRVMDRYYVIWVMLGLLIPTAIGGLVTQSWHGAWSALLWGGFVRLFCDQHALWWGIVTICHRFGYQSYRSNDESRNHWLVAILFLGDGWHNNHHAFPASARIGLAWWEHDPIWKMIQLMQKLGVVWDVKQPSPESLAQKRV